MQSIKTRVVAAGAMGLLIVVVLGVVGVFGIRNGLDILETVFEHHVEPAGQIQEIERNLKEIRFRIAAVLLDHMPTVGSRNHLREARTTIDERWQAFKATVAAHDMQADQATGKLLERIDQPMAALPAFLDKVDGAYANDDKKLLASLLEDEWPVFHANLIKPLGELLPLQQAAVKRIFEENRQVGARLLALAFGATATGVVLMLALAFVLLRVARRIDVGVRSIQTSLAEVAQGRLGVAQKDKHLERNDEFGQMNQHLQTAVGKLAEVTSGVSRLADQVAATANDLLGRMSTVMERGSARNDAMLHVGQAAGEISTSSREVAEFAAVSEVAATHNEEAALAGSNDMAKGLEITREVVDVARESATTVERLHGSIQEIGKIAIVIKEIADQTNLLALNAAIEAARAGEAGRGFAVVADEVRKLAERTALSTNEISRVITSIRQETEATVVAMQKVSQRVDEAANYNQSTGRTLAGIVSGAQESTRQVRQIAARMHAQSTATAEMSRRIAEIAALSESNAGSIREAVGATREMSTVAGRLHELVSYFRA